MTRATEAPPLPVELAIHHARVLTMDGQRRELPDASIFVDGGRIVEIAPAGEVGSRYRPRREIDATGKAALPGLINAHCHLFQVMCRGLGDGCDLSRWAEQAIWPVAHHLDAASTEIAARLACIESIEAGVTTVVDSHYLHGDREAQEAVARACLETGVRAILTRAAMDSEPIEARFREPPARAVAATERFIAEWNGKGDRLLVRPEAMNEVVASRELILALRQLSREAGVGFHMHAAEARARPESLKQQVGFRSIEYLAHLDVLGPDVVLAHCVWLSDEEIALLAASGTAVVHNPVSNQFLADGVAPIPALLRAGVKVALGTDGPASNNSLDMLEVMKASALLHKVHHLQATLMDAATVLELATIAGARALGIGRLTGSLEPGKRADILLVTLEAPRMIPCYSLVSNLIYSAASVIVDTVIIEGQIVAEQGRCTSVDRDAVLREAVALGERLAHVVPLPPHARAS